ncbi:ABC1 kinase family protein [Lignipirellula cremea]|uniref:Protein kinase domain-containing protein n=1 Tax=Lignipirellula cremea TaxID=2528010 RepID=A0A518DVX2_9BACT|nr:AarF/UbiB family protein [Lignipirellula cremea]QDU95979.1 putative protein kinase UbiB [Lignipirellula cremea]
MISLQPKHLTRFRDIGWLLIKYGHSDLVKQSGLAEAFNDEAWERDGSSNANAEEFAADLEKLGPTYVKLGQLLSTRPDVVSAPYREALERLQDQVDPLDFDQIEAILVQELKGPLEDTFADFCREPLAAASLGQVHRAVLRDGAPVAVKVQRPGVREMVIDDLDALRELARLLDHHTEIGQQYEFERLLDSLRRSLLLELDYRVEAANYASLRKALEKYPHLTTPLVKQELTTGRMLVMEFIDGVKVTELEEAGIGRIDGEALAEDLFEAYLHQVLVSGFFHADPHPGNILLAADGRLAMIDLGMVARVPPRLQANLLKVLLTIAEGRGEETADIVLSMGYRRRNFDKEEFLRRICDLVSDNRDLSVNQISLGRVLFEIQRAAAETGIRLPQSFTMLGKTLLNLDKTLRCLHPEMDLNEAVSNHVTAIFRRRTRNEMSLGKLYQSLIEMNELATTLPSRLNKILRMLSENEIRVNVDAIDERQLVEGIQKVANRITIGLLLASLIIGASLMTQVQTSWTLLGYPAIATVFFLLAAIGAVVLIVNTLLSDRQSRD